MSEDLFSTHQPVCNREIAPSFSDDPCPLCVAKDGEYGWGNVCCRARFVISLPGIDWRRGWMARWKMKELPDFYMAIEHAVKKLWENKTGVAHG